MKEWIWEKKKKKQNEVIWIDKKVNSWCDGKTKGAYLISN